MKATYGIFLAALAFASAVHAGERRYSATNPAWKAECASCHVAYPPQLMSAEAWRRTMAGLERHFGTDASVDAAAKAEIERFLIANASQRRGAAPGEPPRITDTPWFVREHRKVPATAWRDAALKSRSNCAACHTRADQGDFSERSLRLPY